jgi:hypothetical protein
MTNLAINLANSLANDVENDLSGDSLVDLITFANASPRYLLALPTGYEPQIASFVAGVPAMCSFGGERWAQIEGATQNIGTYSNSFNNSTFKTGTSVESPQTQLDPLGTNTACLITETAINNFHVCYNACDYASSKYYIHMIWVKRYASSTRWLRFIYDTGEHASWFNPVTGEWGTKYSEHKGHFAIPLAGGYLVGYYFTGLGSGKNGVMVCFARSDGESSAYLGDITQGAIFWQRQIQYNTPYPTSPILTTTTAVTRAKDEAYVAAAKVPSAARNKIVIKICPRYSDVQLALAASNKYLLSFSDSGANSFALYLSGTDKKVHLAINGSAVALSSALTWSANQVLRADINRLNGTFALAGFTTGNGTTSLSAWNAPTGNMYIGQDTSNANQIDGLIAMRTL